MSETANWAYTNVSTLWRNLGRDPETREPTWGAPHVIACTFSTMGDTQTDDNGNEFVPQDTVWHEDKVQIGPGDRVVIGAVSDALTPPVNAKTIRKVGSWDMSFFDEEPDFVFFT